MPDCTRSCFRGSIFANEVASATVETADAVSERQASAIALAALNGIAPHKFIGGDAEPVYVACKWNLLREFTTPNAVETWLTQITVADHPGRRERARRESINAANRRRDRLDESADYRRGPGGGR